MTKPMQVLYLSHNGMTEPLGQSQVLPYARGLARLGWKFDILSFEPVGTSQDELVALQRSLGEQGIGYFWLRRQPGHSLITKAAEITKSFAYLSHTALKRRPCIVHARSYLPAPAAKLLATLTPGAKFLFDCRGLLGDEFVDTGHWQRKSLRYRALKHAERYLFSHADGLVLLTHKLKRWLVEETGMVSPDIPAEVIPCCVDLEKFKPRAEERARTRTQLAVGDRLVLAYVGSLNSFYCEEEMAQFFAFLRRQRDALFLVLTRSPTARLETALAHCGVPASAVVIRAAASQDVPKWLAGADATISFIEPFFSKLASSPIKVAEYLAMGLPVVMNRGIGDCDEILDNVAATIDAGTLQTEELERAAGILAQSDGAHLGKTAREAARSRFSLTEVGLPRYHRIYQQLAGIKQV